MSCANDYTMTDTTALRVLHIIATLRGGGAETLVRELVPRLSRRGIDVSVLSAYDPRLTDDEYISLPYLLLRGEKRGRFDTGFPARTIAAIARLRPDIVHTHTVTGKYWGRACALAAGVPRIVHTEHSPQSRLARWEPPFAHALVGRTDAFVTFSSRTAAFIAAREPVPRIEVIPNGIAIPAAPSAYDRHGARAALLAPDGTIVIGVVANFQPQKNQRLAIESFARLAPAERSRVRLDFFGAGPEEGALRALAGHLGVIDRVKFWGFRPDVRRLLPGLDLLLTVATLEAAPISLLEAMAAQLPILGTPHHGTLDLVIDKETGTVISDWSPAHVTAALRHAIADRDWRVAAGAAGRRRLITTFDIETVADRHVEFYHSLFGEPRARRRPRVDAHIAAPHLPQVYEPAHS